METFYEEHAINLDQAQPALGHLALNPCQRIWGIKRNTNEMVPPHSIYLSHQVLPLIIYQTL